MILDHLGNLSWMTSQSLHNRSTVDHLYFGTVVADAVSVRLAMSG